MNTDWQKMVLVPCLQLAIKYKPDFPIINHFMLRTRSFNPQERADENLQSIPVIPDCRHLTVPEKFQVPAQVPLALQMLLRLRVMVVSGIST